MTAADKAKLLALADEWWPVPLLKPRTDVYSAMAVCADELRALVAELDSADEWQAYVESFVGEAAMQALRREFDEGKRAPR